MNRFASLTLAALTIALTTTVVSCNVATDVRTSPAPSVTWNAPSILTEAVRCQEDDPCWQCDSMGNRVCGPKNDAERAEAWKVWDYSNGAHRLKIDTSHKFVVKYVGRSTDYPARLTDNQSALVGKDGKWYVFEAFVTH